MNNNDALELVATRCAKLAQTYIDEQIAQQLLAVYDEYGIDGLLASLREMADRPRTS